MKYRIVKHHLTGFLAGMFTTEETTVEYQCNKEYKSCCGKSAYIIVKITTI